VATKKERQRRLAREAHERRQQRQVDRDRRVKQISVSVIAAVLVVGVGIGSALAAGVFGGNSKHKPTAGASPAASASPSPSASASPSTPLTAMVNGKCIYTPSGTAARKVKFPPTKPDTKATYQATIATNRGNIVIKLLNSKAPCTVNSFVSLADQNYFSRTHCHRLVTTGIYVLQCGDPTGTGTGGPGYAFYTENLTGAKYPTGTVAMANSNSPDTNGSQFFIVYKNTNLPPSYTPFGTIVSGLNIIQNVAKAGTVSSSGDGPPKEPVDIKSVMIKKT